MRSYESFANKRVVLEISADRALSTTLEAVYAIGGPSWRPAYDVRVLSDKGLVELVTYGVVRQTTGEDWGNVELTLSTALPHGGADLPELLSWRLGDRQQYRVASAQGMVGDMSGGLAVEAEKTRPMVDTESTSVNV